MKRCYTNEPSPSLGLSLSPNPKPNRCINYTYSGECSSPKNVENILSPHNFVVESSKGLQVQSCSIEERVTRLGLGLELDVLG